jgi:hypothetical protein
MIQITEYDALELIEPRYYKPPFPYFGGKAIIASEVWRRFGEVQNYVEPFFGSGAVLMLRPHHPGIETVNDLNGWLANFWRALQHDPEGVAHWADYPVSELDLHARGDWLFYRKESTEFIERLRSDPEFYDAKSAGWWVWGQCCWIAGGWGPSNQGTVGKRRPHLGSAGRGVHHKRPHLGSAGMGVHRQRPHLSDAGNGVHRPNTNIMEYFRAISNRLRHIRICCGDWSRVCGPTPTVIHGLTGVFLDPPYSDKANRAKGCYEEDSLSVAHDVREWAIERGNDPRLRIALCGYEGEHAMPDDWECLMWKATGGYGRLGNGKAKINLHRERIWFSPHCLKPRVYNQMSMFDGGAQ